MRRKRFAFIPFNAENFKILKLHLLSELRDACLCRLSELKDACFCHLSQLRGACFYHLSDLRDICLCHLSGLLDALASVNFKILKFYNCKFYRQINIDRNFIILKFKPN